MLQFSLGHVRKTSKNKTKIAVLENKLKNSIQYRLLKRAKRSKRKNKVYV